MWTGGVLEGFETRIPCDANPCAPPHPSQAIKNNAGFRVWVLFFLVMCSFSLLFLDWYDS